MRFFFIIGILCFIYVFPSSGYPTSQDDISELGSTINNIDPIIGIPRILNLIQQLNSQARASLISLVPAMLSTNQQTAETYFFQWYLQLDQTSQVNVIFRFKLSLQI